MGRVCASSGCAIVANITQQVVLRVGVLVRHFRLNELRHVERDREVYNCRILLNKEPVLCKSEDDKRMDITLIVKNYS